VVVVVGVVVVIMTKKSAQPFSLRFESTTAVIILTEDHDMTLGKSVKRPTT
jgi:hypothetical protein